ncbi:MAG: anti-sigma factor [Proteobacteria bacterium]|nr:anti-sigma factor [Pseudomonadota bacterium]
MNKERIGKEQLHAYVDGQLSAAESAQISAHLVDHADDRASVEIWRNQKTLLHAAYDRQLDAPIPHAIAAQLNSRPNKHFRQATIAAAWLAMGIGIGFVADRQFSPTPTDPTLALASLPQRAAVAHAVFTPEVHHPVEVGADQEAHLTAWLSKRLGHTLRAPKLAAEGFHLVGGRLIAADNGPGALLMYEDGGGQRLTLYVCTDNQDSGATAFRFAHQDGVSTFYWIDGRQAYALSGKLPRESLLPIANAVYRQLNGEG